MSRTNPVASVCLARTPSVIPLAQQDIFDAQLLQDNAALSRSLPFALSLAPPSARWAWPSQQSALTFAFVHFCPEVYTSASCSSLFALPGREAVIEREEKGIRMTGESSEEKRLRLGRSLTVVFRHLICYKVNVGALSMPKAPTTKSGNGTERSLVLIPRTYPNSPILHSPLPPFSSFKQESNIYRLLD